MLSLRFVSALSLGLLASCASSRTTAEAAVGVGSYSLSVDGVGGDTTDGALFELALESVSSSQFGGGARLRGIGSGDDLETFGGPPNESVQASDGLFYVHATYDPGDGAKRLPLRLGLASNVLDVEGQITGDSLTWSSVGPRLEFSPQIPLTKSDGFNLAATGLLGIGYGFTNVELDTATTDWTTSAFYFDLGLGLRADFKSVYLDLGFRYLSSKYDESDPAFDGSNLVVIRGVDADFTGVVLGFGAKF